MVIRTRTRQPRHRLFPIILLALLFVPIPPLSQSAEEAPAQTQSEQRIELLMRNYDFILTHPLPIRFGVPTVIILRNQDIVAHGFQSSALPLLKIRAHGEGLAAYGTGIEGFHIDPGKTLAVHFVPERSGHLTFHCDLHPQMKGELFLLEIPAA
ncbi:MAG: hypothetical protein HY348_14665 [Nitrospira defluvii]|nr:hypothetical protein [Nitrospira defluvii]